MQDECERLQASVNTLLIRHLLSGEPRPIRVFRVARPGQRILLTLHRVRSAFEDKLRWTDQGRSAIAAWERELLVELGPLIWRAVEEYTGASVVGGFQLVHGPDGIPTLVVEVDRDPGTSRRNAASAGMN